MHRLSVPDLDTMELMLKDPSGCYRPPKRREEFCCSGFSKSRQGLSLENKKDSMYNMRYTMRRYRRPVRRFRELGTYTGSSKKKSVCEKPSNGEMEMATTNSDFWWEKQPTSTIKKKETKGACEKLSNGDMEMATTNSDFWWEKQPTSTIKTKETKDEIKNKDSLKSDNINKLRKKDSNTKPHIANSRMEKKETKQISKLPFIKKQHKTDVNTNKTSTNLRCSINKVPMTLPKIETTNTKRREILSLESDSNIHQSVGSYGKHYEVNKTIKSPELYSYPCSSRKSTPWINNVTHGRDVGETEAEIIKRMSNAEKSWSYCCLRQSPRRGMVLSGKSSLKAHSSGLTITSEFDEKEEKIVTPRSSQHERIQYDKNDVFYDKPKEMQVLNVTPDASPQISNYSDDDYQIFINDDSNLSMACDLSSKSESEDFEMITPANSPLPNTKTINLDNLPSNNIDITSLLTEDIIGKNNGYLPKEITDDMNEENNHRCPSHVKEHGKPTVWKLLYPYTAEHCQVTSPFVITPKPLYRRNIPARRYLPEYKRIPCRNKMSNSGKLTPVVRSKKTSTKTKGRSVKPKIHTNENKETTSSEQLENDLDSDEVYKYGTVAKPKYEYKQILHEMLEKPVKTISSASIPTRMDVQTQVSLNEITEERELTHETNSRDYQYQIEIHNELKYYQKSSSNLNEHELDNVSTTSYQENDEHETNSISNPSRLDMEDHGLHTVSKTSQQDSDEHETNSISKLSQLDINDHELDIIYNYNQLDIEDHELHTTSKISQQESGEHEHYYISKSSQLDIEDHEQLTISKTSQQESDQHESDYFSKASQLDIEDHESISQSSQLYTEDHELHNISQSSYLDTEDYEVHPNSQSSQLDIGNESKSDSFSSISGTSKISIYDILLSEKRKNNSDKISRNENMKNSKSMLKYDKIEKVSYQKRKIHHKQIPTHAIGTGTLDHVLVTAKDMKKQSTKTRHGRRHDNPLHKEINFETPALRNRVEISPKFVRKSLKEASLYFNKDSESPSTLKGAAGDDLETDHSKNFQIDTVMKRSWYRNVGRKSCEEDFASIKRAPFTSKRQDTAGSS